MTDQELIAHLDRIAFESGPSDTTKLERIQNALYQVEQMRTANSIRQEEYLNKLLQGEEFPNDYDGPIYNTPNTRRV